MAIQFEISGKCKYLKATCPEIAQLDKYLLCLHEVFEECRKARCNGFVLDLARGPEHLAISDLYYFGDKLAELSVGFEGRMALVADKKREYHYGFLESMLVKRGIEAQCFSEHQAAHDWLCQGTA